MHPSKRILCATSSRFSDLTPDDRLLVSALKKIGVQAEAAVWSDPSIGWAHYDAVILRSCWDYHLRLAEFLAWIERLEKAGVPVWNSPDMVRWNANKTYLRDLERRGVPIVPTLWPETSLNLREQLHALGWQHAVIKPRVSATAHRTELIFADEAHLAQPLVDDLIAGPGVMVQQFMDEIQSRGEWSLIFFVGKFSHSVIKIPKAGDFRVQNDFGGLERSVEAPTEIRNAAERVVAALDQVPLYARVDGVEHNGRFLLMELELIEPVLFLDASPGADLRFAQAIISALPKK